MYFKIFINIYIYSIFFEISFYNNSITMVIECVLALSHEKCSNSTCGKNSNTLSDKNIIYKEYLRHTFYQSVPDELDRTTNKLRDCTLHFNILCYLIMLTFSGFFKTYMKVKQQPNNANHNRIRHFI